MYELRTLVIEPKRRTYRHVQERVGDRAPTRYEEATIGVQSLEGFHYRPLWAPDRDLYDPAWSRLRRAGGTEWLAAIKQAWIEHPAHQPARKMIEELLVEPDWAVGLVALDLADSLIFPLLFSHLVERAFTEGVSYYSLPAPFVWQWYQEQAKWLGVLRQTWLDDPEHGEANAAALADIARRWRPSALGAARALAGRIDELMGDAAATDC